MAIALADSRLTHGNTATSGMTTSATGDTFVMVFTGGDGNTTNPQDSYSNSWGSPIVNLQGGGAALRIWVVQNANGGAGHTFQIPGAGGDTVTTVARVTGAATSSLDSPVTASVIDASDPRVVTGASTLAQAAELVLSFMLPYTSGNPVNYQCDTGYTFYQQENNNNVYYGQGAASKVVASTAAPTATWSITGGSGDLFMALIALKEAASSTWDRAESSAGTEASNRTMAVAADRAESSAGTEASNRTMAIARDAAESSAGATTQDRTVAIATAASESSAGTEAEDRTLAIARDAAESSAGTEAEDRTVAVSRDGSESSAGDTTQDFTSGSQNDAAETSAGTEAQDRTVALSGDAAESSAGTTAQDRSVPLDGAVGESSGATESQDRAIALQRDGAETGVGADAQDRTISAAGSASETSLGDATQDRTVALGRDAAESSASDTAQDYLAGAIWTTNESSGSDTAQDRTVDTGTWDVSESSNGSANQSYVPPPSVGQSALRRWLIQQYTQEQEARAAQKAAEAAQKAAAEAPAPPKDNRRPVLRLKKVDKVDYEKSLDKAIAQAQALMSDYGADAERMYSIVVQNTATKKLLSKANAIAAEADMMAEHPTWRKLGQAEWDDDDLLLLAHVL